MTAQQPIPDSVGYHDAVERFRPDDVDWDTHDPRLCNLPVTVCPACSWDEHAC